MGSLHLSCGMFKISTEVDMFRKEEICDVNKRIEWWDENALFVSETLERVIKCFVYDKDEIYDVATDVLCELSSRVWKNNEFKFYLDKISKWEKVNSFSDFFNQNIFLLLNYTYGSNYRYAIMRILRKYNAPVKNIEMIEKDLKKIMMNSEYNYSEDDINNKNKPEVFIAETDENELTDDKIADSDMMIFIDELCYSINELKETSNKTILLAFFQHDENQPVILILTNYRKFKNTSIEAEISKPKNTLYKINAMFRMCLILDINDCLKSLKNDTHDVIVHAFLTKTENEREFHRADNLYSEKKPMDTKTIRKKGTTTLKERFQKSKFDSVLTRIYSEFFKSYESERDIQEALRL